MSGLATERPPAGEDVATLERETFASTPGASGAVGLVIEVPHGATRRSDFDSLRRRLRGSLPEGLEDLFFVNTDVGAPECAREVAALVVEPESDPALLELLGPARRSRLAQLPARQVTVLRCLLPRSFVDCNRVVDRAAEAAQAGLNGALPAYLHDPSDVALLTGLAERYQVQASRTVDAACSAGGLALLLHSYAPRAVQLDDLGDGVVAAIRRAYAPEIYDRWPRRPAVDVIDLPREDGRLSSSRLIAELRRCYREIGVCMEENASYLLHPSTVGYHRAARFPGQVLCVEIDRSLLADPFVPFAEMRVPAERARRMARPLAAALLGEVMDRAAAG